MTSGDTTLEEAIEYWNLIKENDLLINVPDTSGVNIPADKSGINPADIIYPNNETIENLFTALNAHRSFNHLDPVSVSSDLSLAQSAQKGAIVSAREENISHGLLGFTNSDPDAVNITRLSVLSSHNPYQHAIETYVIDDYNVIDNVGHRVQVLSPDLSQTVLGLATENGIISYSVIPTHSGEFNNDAYFPETLEWPAAGYIPYALIPKQRWSFSASDIGDDIKVSVTHIDGNGNKEFIETYDVNTNTDSFQTILGRRYEHVVQFKLADSVVKPEDGNIETYVVNIESDTSHWQYSVKVFDETADVYRDTGHVSSHVADKSDVLIASSHSEDSIMAIQDALENMNLDSLDNTLSAYQRNPDVLGGDDNFKLLMMEDDIYLGGGNDTLLLDTYLSGSADGGEGHDTLQFTQGGNVTKLAHFTNFEHINLGEQEDGVLPNILDISLNDVLNNHDEEGILWLEGGSGNLVSLEENAVGSISTVMVNESEYQNIVYGNESVQYHLMINNTLFDNGNGLIIG